MPEITPDETWDEMFDEIYLTTYAANLGEHDSAEEARMAARRSPGSSRPPTSSTSRPGSAATRFRSPSSAFT